MEEKYETRKKILYVITKSNWGGAQKYVYDLATSLADQYDVAVALGGDGVLKRKLESAGIRTIPVPGLVRDISLAKELAATLHLWRIIRAERPHIIHLNSSKAGGIGALIARLLRAPHIVFTAHAWAFNESRNSIVKIVLKAAHWATILLAHTTIAVSHAVKDQMAHLPGTERKMTVIYPGVADTIPLARTDARAYFAERIDRSIEDTFVVGTVAELHPTKDYRTALSAFATFHKAHPRSTYIIISTGSEEAALKAHANELGIIDAVHFLGFVEHAARYISGFDAFLLTSRSEAFGYVLAEAGHASVPVIATRVGGVPEVVANPAMGTLIAPGDDGAAAKALGGLAVSDVQRRQQGAALNAHVQATFSLSRMTAETQRVYESEV